MGSTGPQTPLMIVKILSDMSEVVKNLQKKIMIIGGGAYKAKVSIYPVLSPKWAYDMGKTGP